MDHTQKITDFLGPIEVLDNLEDTPDAEGLELKGGSSYLLYKVDGEVKFHQVEEDAVTFIGRSTFSDIRFDDASVSRKHALIRLKDGRASLIDNRSLNGIYLNGERIDESALSSGDVFHVGRHAITFISVPSEV